MDAALAALLNQGSSYLLAGVVPGRLGNRHPSIAPYATYQAADAPFALAVGSDALWQRLRTLLDLADDPRWQTNTGRREHVDELDAVLGRAFATAPAEDWVQRLLEAGIPAGPINDVAGAFDLAREIGLEPTVSIDGMELLRTPVRLSRTPGTVRLPPPELDGDGVALRAWLAEE
jgi:crotonobetainyl-CoA:carnitine CoA-transferase CaiB-like acyl-CoA transferase